MTLAHADTLNKDAGIYVRLSEATLANRANLVDQREDCEALCRSRNWRVVEAYVDDDRSAYSGKKRPAYERMLADLRAGRITAIAAKANDRLHRSPAELEAFIALVETTGAAVAVCPEGSGEDYDLTTSDGRFKARIVGAVARKESEDKSRRLRRKHEQLAMAGLNGGGGTRPFGFGRLERDDETGQLDFGKDRTTVYEPEAALIREAAHRVTAGDTVHAVLSDWAKRGVATVTGKPWRTTTMRRLLMSPRIAGLRELRGESVGEAEWDAIISQADHERLRRILSDPARRKGGRPREYLLTGGLVVCGHADCGRPLVARPKQDGRRNYVCAKGVDFRGCARLAILAEPLEEVIREAVILRLSSPALYEMLATQGHEGERAEALERLRAAEEAMGELDVDYYELRRISRGRYLEASQRLEAQAQEARDLLSRGAGAFVVKGLPRHEGALRVAWNAGSNDWRRALVAALMHKVAVGPAVKGRNFFDPARLMPPFGPAWNDAS